MKVPASPPDRFSHGSYSPKPRMSPTGSPNDGWGVSPGEAKVCTTLHCCLFLTLCSPPPAHLLFWHPFAAIAVIILTLHRIFPVCDTAIAPKICLAALGEWAGMPCSTGRFLLHPQSISTCQVRPVATTLNFSRTTVAKCTFKDRNPSICGPPPILFLHPLQTLRVCPVPIRNCIETFNLLCQRLQANRHSPPV